MYNSHPLIYEINTWPWLKDLSNQYGVQIFLDNLPEEIIIQELASYDAIWLMGIWERSPQGQKIAQTHPGLQKEYQRVLKDLKEEDIVGSPYAIYNYHVDPQIGTDAGLQSLAKRLHEHGIKIIVDFVPNHLACDHKWQQNHPEYFIQGTEFDLKEEPKTFFKSENGIFAHGKDPYFDAWTDTLQFNAFSQEMRNEVKKLLKWIATFADGVRCDMAMLLNTNIFQRTWTTKAKYPLVQEYWKEIVTDVKQKYPNFIFIAEVYWDLEWELQQLGFDFCYDKLLYDRLRQGNIDSIKGHLKADLNYQTKLVRFIENHDESRAFEIFGPKKSKLLATFLYTLPGARLLHQGQRQGRKIKIPVQLGRIPNEINQTWLDEYYGTLIDLNLFDLSSEGSWRQISTDLLSNQMELYPIIAYYWDFPSKIILVLCNFADYDIISSLPILNFNPLRKNLKCSKILNSEEGFMEVKTVNDCKNAINFAIPKLTGSIYIWNKK
ncbi:alpha-amylase family glycosyl hydrolase [Candidatus Lokiarchaeum ossiferum]|uniref:alpha-amylase family glycosyl hydrolase n=1 Tax=Candidatus Lokiarchaeum ossiferum TaxID=2951803 RepID=UPI00352D0FDE